MRFFAAESECHYLYLEHVVCDWVSGHRLKGEKAMRKHAMLIRGIVGLLLALSAASWATAQFTSGIEGIVKDPSGAVIPNVSVKLTSIATGVSRDTTTDSAGYYRFVSLPPTDYRIVASLAGFSNTVIQVTVVTGQLMNVPIELTLARTTQNIEVTGQAPVVDTSETRNQTTLTSTAVESLPIGSRSVITLAEMVPGVTGTGTSASSRLDNFSTYSNYYPDLNANGQNGNGNLFTLDGMDIISNIRPGALDMSPNPDSVQEVAVQINTFNVEYGRAASVQVAMTTKSGTNEFHGSASDYFTNQRLAAGTEFVHNQAPFHTNYPAGLFGGPISAKHQWFFFASAEAKRSSVATGNGVVTYEDPSFVQWAQQNYPDNLGTKLLSQYPASKATTTGVLKMASDIFPTTCGTLATANLPCSLPMIDGGIFNATNYANGLQYNFRIDKNFSKDRIYGLFYRTTANSGGTPLRTDMATTNFAPFWTLKIDETHTFSPTLLNEATWQNYRVEGITPKTGNFHVPVVSVGGMSAGIGDGFAEGDYIQHNYRWRDVVTFMRGRHTVNVGYEGWNGDDVAKFQGPWSQANFYFISLLDLVQDAPYDETSLAYDPLTGEPTPGNYSYAMTTHGAFVQDKLKVTSNVTANFGLRWDDFGNAYPTQGTNLSNFFLGPGQDFNEQVANGYMKVTGHSFNHSMSTVFSPRGGIAWDITGKASWVIRGGAGVYHDWPTLGNQENGIRQNPPGFGFPTFYANSATPPVFSEGTQNTYPYGFSYPFYPPTGLNDHGGLIGEQLSVGGIDPNLRVPNTYNYTATLEHLLGHGFVASVGYSGSHSTSLMNTYGTAFNVSFGADVNRFAGDLITNKGHLTRLNPSFGSIVYCFNQASSTYNALIVDVKGRFRRGFIDASYTRSSSYDDMGTYPTALNLQQYWSPSAFDAPNRVSIIEGYLLPGAKSNALLRRLTNGWNLESSTILQSGTPFTVYTGAPFNPVFDAQGNVIGLQAGSGDYNADGYNLDYPGIPSTGYKQGHSRDAYLSGLWPASAFGIPTLGSEGNEKPQQFRNPGFAEVNFGLLKDNSITERIRLQLRFEFYNLFNRPNLGGVDSNLADGTFGMVTSQLSPRWIQFGAKLSF
jgi:hypothetical protein